MKKVFFLFSFVSFLSIFQLQADDMGFRFTPAMTPMIGVVDDEVDLQVSFDAEVTYLIFNQLEFGVGGGWHRQEISNAKEDTFFISEDIQKVFTVPEIIANTYPYYGVIRYSFDFFEKSYLVLAFKYGRYYILSRDKVQSGVLPITNSSGPTEESISFKNRLHNATFLAFNIGYDMSRTIISFEYRLSKMKQDLDYINPNTEQTVENNFSRSSHFFGVNLSYKIDLF